MAVVYALTGKHTFTTEDKSGEKFIEQVKNQDLMFFNSYQNTNSNQPNFDDKKTPTPKK